MAAESAGCLPSQMVHVGDVENKDIEGARGVGARAVLFQRESNTSGKSSRANAIVNDITQLESLLCRWVDDEQSTDTSSNSKL